MAWDRMGASSLREQLPQKNKRMEVSILFDVSRKRKREYQIKYNLVYKKTTQGF